jgi:Ner family transcriptional regulator
MLRNWDKHSIKAEIHRRGATLTQLAVDHGLGSCSCRVGLIHPMPAANRVIAAFLGVPLHELWPTWYDTAGNRLRAKRKSNSIRSRRKSRAASAAVTSVTVPSRAGAPHHAVVEEAA